MFIGNLIIVLILVLEAQGKTTHNHDHQSFTNRLTTYLKRKCNKNATIEDLQKSLETYNKAKTCFKKKFPKPATTDTGKLKENCLETVVEITECIQLFLSTIKPCLDEEEQFLPNFISEAYEGYAESFCKYSYMIIIPNILDNGIVPCINRFSKYKETNPQYVCYEFTKFANHGDTSPITKKEICNDLDNLYDCYELHYKQFCKESPAAWKFEGELLNGMRKPCKEK